jgi:HK97 family phage prohead protease
MTQFIDLHQFRELAAAGDTAGFGVERPARVLRAGDEDSRTVRFVLSDSSVDRVGDTIAASGWRLGPYKQNPVVLFCHDSNAPPVGRMVNIFVSGDRLIGDVRFPDAATYEFGDQVFRLIKAGYINAGSVGFFPLKFSFAKEDDRPFGIDFQEQELLEFSVVPVPANANALVQAAVKSLARRSPAQRSTPQPTTLSFSGTAAERQRQLAAATAPERHRRAHQLLDLAIAGADAGTVEGRRRIARAHKHYIEQMRR